MSKNKNKGNRPTQEQEVTEAPATETPVTEEATTAPEMNTEEATPEVTPEAPAEEVKEEEAPKEEPKEEVKEEPKAEKAKPAPGETSAEEVLNFLKGLDLKNLTGGGLANQMKTAFTFKKKFKTATPERQMGKPNQVDRPTHGRRKNRLTTPAVNGVHHNPTFLMYPTDKWGLTKDLKAAFASVASRIAGSSDKKALVDEVIRIGLGHVEAKFSVDKIKRDEQMAKAQAEAEARKEKE